MKRLLGWLLMLCVLLGCGASAEENSWTLGYLQGGPEASVIIYDSARENANMLGCYLPGTPVMILSAQQDWARVRLGHQLAYEDEIVGFVHADQVGETAPETELPAATLQGSADEEDIAVGSDCANLSTGFYPQGTSVQLIGQYEGYWAILLDGATGTIEKQYVAMTDEVQARMEKALDATYVEKVEQRLAALRAVEEYTASVEAEYGYETAAWPLEQRAELCRLEGLAGIKAYWQDLLPTPDVLTEAEATARAVDIFKTLWNIDPQAEDWSIYVAYGYNVMQPTIRLWQFTFQRTNYTFVLQLTATDGVCYRTSDTETFAQLLQSNGQTFDDVLTAWEERLGGDYEQWSLQDQYDFSQLPIVRLSSYMQDAVMPGPGAISQEEAISNAKLALIRRFGMEEAELDTLCLSVQGQHSNAYADDCYYFIWREQPEPGEKIGNMLYGVYVSMNTGEVYATEGPEDGNG